MNISKKLNEFKHKFIALVNAQLKAELIYGEKHDVFFIKCEVKNYIKKVKPFRKISCDKIKDKELKCDVCGNEAFLLKEYIVLDMYKNKGCCYKCFPSYIIKYYP